MKIKVYTYCSYRYSPVGFKHGVFQLDTENCNAEYTVPITEVTIPSIVRDFFEESLIQKVSGKIPETNEYIILIKNLEYDYINGNGKASKKYGNFAFLTTDSKAYNIINNNIGNMSMLQLSEAMNSFLIPDSNAGEAAIKIDNKKLIDSIIDVSDLSHYNENMDDFSILLYSSGVKIIQKISNQFPEYDIIPTSDNLYRLKKKECISSTTTQLLKDYPTIASLIIIALIAIIIFCLSWINLDVK